MGKMSSLLCLAVVVASCQAQQFNQDKPPFNAQRQSPYNNPGPPPYNSQGPPPYNSQGRPPFNGQSQPTFNPMFSPRGPWHHRFFSRPPPGPTGSRYDPNPKTCSPETCKLPECYCVGKEAPNKMEKTKIPQIVMFTFDDAINEQVFDYYKELFPPERLNPNGCPVSVTFFVSHNWTDYSMVKDMYLRGHEIGSHSITHRMPQSWWTHATYDTLYKELNGQRDNIVQKASIPKSEVRGLRLPFLEIGGDNQFKMMRDVEFEYDASFMTGPYPDGGLWPFTLDYPAPFPKVCGNNNCPKTSWPGIWEIALNRWYGPDGHPCAMVDSCVTQPKHKGEALSYLWQNFNRHYYGNKSPVGVNMHAVWFQTPHHLEAMQEFVSTLAEMEDVYIVTVHQTLQWMKDPKTLDEVKDWQPWMSSCQSKNKKKLVKMVPRTQPVTTTEAMTDEEQEKESGNTEIEIDIDMDKGGRKRKGGKSKENRSKENSTSNKSRNGNKDKDDSSKEKGGRRPSQRGGRGKGQGGMADHQSRGRSSSSGHAAYFLTTATGVVMVMVASVGRRELL